MRNLSWKKWLRSWWGRLLVGAFIGGLLVAFSGLNDPVAFVWGMVLGALAMFFLGRLT